MTTPESTARALAREHRAAATIRTRGRANLHRRLNAIEKAVTSAIRCVTEAPADVRFPFTGAEWLLDNEYLVRESIEQVRENLPPRYFRELPRVEVAGDLFPRIQGMVRVVLDQELDHLDPAFLRRFVAAYQEAQPLTMGELWALPTIVRLVTLEDLAASAASLAAACSGPDAALDAPADLRHERELAACVRTLRTVKSHDWAAFFESLSLVHHRLLADPVGAYARMEFETRDRYRRAVERFAGRSGKSELEVAVAAIELAQEASTARHRHVGWALVTEGRGALARRLDLRPNAATLLAAWWRAHGPAAWVALLLGSTLVLALALGSWLGGLGISTGPRAALILLASVPILGIVVAIANWLAALLVRPAVLPKLDLSAGIPSAARTLVVVPCLLADADEVDELLQRLETSWLGNRDPRLSCALLADFLDGPAERGPEDAELEDRVRRGVRALNRRHGLEDAPGFHLFLRRRLWNDAEGRWMGWERKRGKLMELNRLLRGALDTSYVEPENPPSDLHAVRYVITLDADTRLPAGAATRLVGALTHPLNVAVRDADDQTVESGYTVLQPRIETLPSSAGRTLFSRISAGDATLDLYSHAVSDVYQDLFGEGIYAGKGIYDVDAFEHSLRGRAPENLLLSHDLFEGAHGRAGLLSDVVLYEEYPSTPKTWYRRMHRWVRGDWQIAAWVGLRVPLPTGARERNPLGLLDRWKIFDNLRRSLQAPALVLLLAAGWLLASVPAWPWTLLAFASAVLPALLAGLTPFLTVLRDRTWRRADREGEAAIRRGIARALVQLVFLPSEAWLALDALARSAWRMVATHERLLEWVPAAVEERRRLGIGPRRAWWGNFLPTIAAMLLGGLIAGARPEALPGALPMLLLWFSAPPAAFLLSRPRRPSRCALTAGERTRIRRVARRTWLFFDRFVGPGDRWLPPDHFQEDPRGTPAHRTSPTNIGMSLLAVLGAWDLGYIGPLGLAARAGNTMGTLRRLPKHRGHLLNWYDTRDLTPLVPAYVSTVDSGNLAAALLVLAAGLEEAAASPLVRKASRDGLVDTLDLLAERLEGLDDPTVDTAASALLRESRRLLRRLAATPAEPEPWARLVRDLTTTWLPKVDRLMVRVLHGGTRVRRRAWTQDLHLWMEQVREHVHGLERTIRILTPWMNLALDLPDDSAPGPPLPPDVTTGWRALRARMLSEAALEDLPEHATDLIGNARDLAARLGHDDVPEAHATTGRRLLDDLVKAAEVTGRRSAALLERVHELAREARECVEQMDFRFLYDTRRRLFRIGYNLTTGEPDPNHYDLLASEARVASFVAIAKRDVPVEHWLHLGRPLTRIYGASVLLSWSASMFEYLMPTLVMRHPDDTLLAQSCRVAIRRQAAYGRRRGRVWGISESGFYAFDQERNYQYRAFGVPGLGFRRDLAEDLVFAPYASLLALPIEPRRVLANLDRLDRLGMMGRYGYFEAVDCTSERFHQEQPFEIVRSYMAHHQGMILTAIVNALSGGGMVERFHRDPNVETAEHLLWEHVPRGAPRAQVPPEIPGRPVAASRPARAEPWAVPARGDSPHLMLLSNGRMCTLVSSVGTGTSWWRGRALTRSNPDPTIESGGISIYVRDEDEGILRSATLQPCGTWPAAGEVVFASHKVEFHRRDDGVFLRTEVGIGPVEDVEIRRVHLSNETDRVRRLTVFSYAEVVLAKQEEDRRHPAFSKLFVEAEAPDPPGTVIFHRRSRSREERPLFLGHAARIHAGGRGRPRVCAAREDFLGRRGSYEDPRGARDVRAWGGRANTSLDPVAATRCPLLLAPHGEAEVVFLWTASRSYEDVLHVLELYSAADHASWAFDLARARSERELQALDLPPTRLPVVQRLLSRLLYPDRRCRVRPASIQAPVRPQSALWSTGVSGDHPILLVRVAAGTTSDLVGLVLRAHAWWSGRGVRADLVLIDEEQSGYEQPARDRLMRELRRVGLEDRLNQPGGVYVLAQERLGADERATLERAAAVVLDTEAGGLDQQIALAEEAPELPRFIATGAVSPEPEAPTRRKAPLLFDNGIGGFTPDGREYVLRLAPEVHTPVPWANVLANEKGGVLVTEAGIGSAWSGNSGENRLTPWHNDPVLDPPSTAIYLRDEETARVWSPTPAPCSSAAPYEVRHRAGETVWRHRSNGLDQELVVHATVEESAFVMRLELQNLFDHPRRITVTCFTEWVLGTTGAHSRPHLLTDYAHEECALLARNPFREEFGTHVAFLAADRPVHGLTCDRGRFLGRNGSAARPNGLRRFGLSGLIVSNADPCGVLQVHVDLPPRGADVVRFVIGDGADRATALELAGRLTARGASDAARARVQERWDHLLGRVHVETPDPATNLLLNRWLPYQNLACRIDARTALYQSSGAFGFRDQLQDVLALLPVEPKRVRRHLLEAAKHQFEEGDVLHWWHPPSGRGVRTRCSDDLLWLPYAAATYVHATGDIGVLDEEVPYLAGSPLRPRERERYAAWSASERGATLYQHCLDAIHRGSTSGRHGLPLLGMSDWNDGIDRLGEKGVGESVWLAWFLARVTQDFAPIAEARGDAGQATRLRAAAVRLQEAADAHAWDGDWYLRAWSDEGDRIGSRESLECRIDLIAQAWSVIARDDGMPTQARRALASAWERLVSQEDRLVRLLAPPFDRAKPHPGYIRGYPPGIRENGGQYSHAAVWLAWAFSVLGDGDSTGALFDLLNPILRTRAPDDMLRYRVEPYVYAADIGGAPPYVGRGGWTWYTGSAGWAWRLGVERLLGLRLEGRSFRIQPCIPATWPGYGMTWRTSGATYEITVRRGDSAASETRFDGRVLEDGCIPLLEDGGTHRVDVRLATSSGIGRREQILSSGEV